MNTVAVLRFARLIMPVVWELICDLFERHKGDPEPAKAEVRRIVDHGRRGEFAESEFDARLAALKQRKPPP